MSTTLRTGDARVPEIGHDGRTFFYREANGMRNSVAVSRQVTSPSEDKDGERRRWTETRFRYVLRYDMGVVDAARLVDALVALIDGGGR